LEFDKEIIYKNTFFKKDSLKGSQNYEMLKFYQSSNKIRFKRKGKINHIQSENLNEK
jgi:hypothetical protein